MLVPAALFGDMLDSAFVAAAVSCFSVLIILRFVVLFGDMSSPLTIAFDVEEVDEEEEEEEFGSAFIVRVVS